MNQVWLSSIDRASSSFTKLAERYLDEDEKERISNFRLPCRRKQYLLSRGLMRLALSNHYKRPLDYWIFSQQPNSAPALDNPISNPLNFSVSHSSTWVVIAISHQAVGVDIEQVLPRNHIARVAKRVFTPQQCAQIASLSEQKALDQFYQLWTCKEALYKVEANAKSRIQIVSSKPWPLEGYAFHKFEHEGYKLALVSKKNSEKFTFFEATDVNDHCQLEGTITK